MCYCLDINFLLNYILNMDRIKIKCLIILLFLLIYPHHYAYCGDNDGLVSIDTEITGNRVRQIISEIKKQTKGKTGIYCASKIYDYTLEINIQNVNFIDVLKLIADRYNDYKQYPRKSIDKEKYFVEAKERMAEKEVYSLCPVKQLVTAGEGIYCHKLKYASFEELKKIILENIPDSEKLLRISYYAVTDSIWINSIDEDMYPMIHHIAEKYDVELIKTNKNLADFPYSPVKRGPQFIFFKTPPGGLPLKRILDEIKKQIGVETLIDPVDKITKIDHGSLTVEVNFFDVFVSNAFEMIVEKIRSKYDPQFAIKKSGDHYRAGSDFSDNFIPATKYVKLKNISSKKMHELLLTDLPDVKIAEDRKNNGIIYFIIDHERVAGLIEKYDK